MRSGLLPLLLLCCFLASLAPAGRAGEIAYPEDIRRIKERGRLIVAQFGGEREGFFAYDDAQESPAESFYLYEGRRLVGFDVDLAQRLADELDVELEIDRNYPSFDAVARGIAAGQADIALSKLSMTTQRAQFVAYTNPYISLRMGLVVNRLVESRSAGAGGQTDTLGICRRAGARVGVLDRSSFVKHGKDLFPDAELVPYPDQETLFRAVMDAEVLAVLYEEYEINKAMHRFPEIPIYCHTVFIPGREDLLAMAVHPEAQTLRELVNMYMAKHNVAPTVAMLIGQYVPEREVAETNATAALSWSNHALLGGLATCVGLLLVWLVLAAGRGPGTRRAAAPAAPGKESE